MFEDNLCTTRAIGVFDSGFGGLTILKDIVKSLPEYDYIYLGDNARAPYGTRSFETVYRYTKEAVGTLFKMGSPLVVLACNTASAKALRSIQQLDLAIMDPSRRVLGVIRPSVEKIPQITNTGHIGVLATRGTVASNSYPLEISKFHGECKYTVTQVACPMWVSLVENNETMGDGAMFFVKKYVAELMNADPLIDTIILGCTHYPMLRNLIEQVLPSGVKVVEQGEVVAASLKDYLRRHVEMESRLTHGGVVRYFTTEQREYFERIAQLFIGYPVKAEHLDLGV